MMKSSPLRSTTNNSVPLSQDSVVNNEEGMDINLLDVEVVATENLLASVPFTDPRYARHSETVSPTVVLSSSIIYLLISPCFSLIYNRE